METVDTAAAVFALLGLPDDKGGATTSPFSARSVWKMCERAHRDYFSFDPQMVAAATEAVIYGTIANFLKYQWGPCCDGKNASAETPKYLVVGNSDHIKGLVEVCLKLEARCVRDSNHHSDLDHRPRHLLPSPPTRSPTAPLLMTPSTPTQLPTMPHQRHELTRPR